jgi:hypothetical protein
MPELETVGRFYTANEAEMARAALEAEGIPAFVADANMVSMLSNAVGWAKLQVGQQDTERARQFLTAWRPPETPEGTPSSLLDMTTCMQCGREMPEWLATCPDCGWTYEAPADAE